MIKIQNLFKIFENFNFALVSDFVLRILPAAAPQPTFSEKQYF